MGESETSELFGLVRELKAALAAQTAIMERVEKDLADKEKRIKDLELKDARRGGIMATIAIVASALGSALAWVFKAVGGAQ